MTHLPANAIRWVYQRYSHAWTRAVLAAGWALLYVLCDASMGAFPVQWRVVLAACIFVGGLFRPAIAYAAFIAAIAYPLYLISIYVMALALAVLILSAPLIAFVPARREAHVRRPDVGLALALLVIAAPLLAPWHLTLVLPLLAGLWWDRTESALAGGLAALWLKMCAAMSGHSTDLWQINGWAMTVEPIYDRFHAANSLQTLARLFAPLAIRDATGSIGSASASASIFLLFNLLQVLAWTMAGYLVSALMYWLYVGWGRGWKAALSLGPGMLLIWAGYVAVPSWLQVEGAKWLSPRWLPAQVVLAGLVAWGLGGVAQYLKQPVVGRQRPARSSAPPSSAFTDASPSSHGDGQPRTARGQTAYDRASRTPLALLKKVKPKPKARDQEDIIMIELD